MNFYTTAPVTKLNTNTTATTHRSTKEMQQPSEQSNSYFPSKISTNSRPSSWSSTASSSVESSPSTSIPQTPLSAQVGSNYPLSPLDRVFEKPAEELDVAKQLAKPPTYWSAHGWIQRTVVTANEDNAAGKLRKQAATDPEERARKRKDELADLMAWRARM